MTDNTIEKAPGACDAEGFDTGTHKLDSATGTQHSKAITTLIAELALAGHTVVIGDHGDFTVCKFGWSRYCANFAEFQAFARKVGVVQ